MQAKLQARYAQRGAVPEAVIETVPFELPALESGEVLLEVLAAPINPSDVLTLTGQYGSLPPLPAVGGNEGVGRVIELGPDTGGIAVGQVVLLPVGSGTWTTHMVANAARLVPLPEVADYEQLSMLAVNPPTAALLLSDFVELQPGDWIIQNAANSAVGSYVIQLAALRGIRTVNVVRRESAVAGVEGQGGDVVVVDGEDLVARVKEAVDGAPIKLAIDAVGGASTRRLASTLAESATIVTYGALSGTPSELSARDLVFNDVTAKGFWLARWFRTTNLAAQVKLFAGLAALIAEGKLSAPVEATYDLSQIKEAVAAAAKGERAGKVILVPNHS
ncbi:zinc-dependent alcohol dehydrogenase family protein [Pseudomonas kurunegalensis]|uniref:zinc-dependent alcohol dehydrogenase family protein n=1 Tax=Pseudomonas kurunegalensis TaxID=485880 RepID=UPI002363F2C6|nr:zinc-dependent alcohol dehydrogenase family protein [Pseudomonas kurunegalensis]MDD2134588.1 zinc-dependent alcohol dehydrogenase family protein [Pseudomonas kurunegalensis]